MRKIFAIFIAVLISALFISCESKSKQKFDQKINYISNPSYEKNPELRSVRKSGKPNGLKVLSWNIQDLGQSKNEQEIEFIVNILKEFDLIAIQEIVAKHPAGAQKVAKIADELNRKGYKWDYSISSPTTSPSAYMSERYAFIWKTNLLQLVGKTYLDSELAYQIFREPFIANFKLKKDNKSFLIANFHSRKFNDHPEEEIKHFHKYRERFNTDYLLISGDFNLNENHEVWDELYQQGFEPALKNVKTTLRQKCSKEDYLSHNIDNIYYSSQINFVNSGIVDFVEDCENLVAARQISDHLPVFLEFDIN